MEAQMNDRLMIFIRSRQIDSYQKLRLLLFLHQNAGARWTRRELTERLYFGNVSLLQKIIIELQNAGLLKRVENSYTLSDEPEVISILEHLARTFEDPLLRQEIFEYMKHIGEQPQLVP
jgi:DNA-binding IscR family transcriptional regulator